MKLVKRDLEIIEYLLEMKQSHIFQIKTRFFENNKYLEGTSKRLKKLNDAGFIKHNKVSQDSNIKYYFPTYLGFEKAIEHSENFLPPPIKKVNTQTLMHDLMVSKIRQQLEEKDNFLHWTSERTIIYLQKKGLIHIEDHYIPDGIATIQGVRTSMELERTLKSQKRIQEKIFDLYFYMNNTNSLFKKCIVFCVSNAIFNRYKFETLQYPSYFEIKLISKTGDL